jgi:putative transposase
MPHHAFPPKHSVGSLTQPAKLSAVNNQVWGTDITYIRLRRGFVYLVAVMDWFSRYVLSWEVSVTLDVSFCLAALEWALKTAQPEIFNSDQGSQFTSEPFTTMLLARDVEISMDGRGRAMDNIFVERLWRTVKYEEVYLKDYENVQEAVESLRHYFLFYNRERIHQSLSYQTPAQVYFQRRARTGISGKPAMNNDRVDVRSSIVGHYSANIFRGNPVQQKEREKKPIETLERPTAFPSFPWALPGCFSFIFV